jgi:hypothetical protein
LTGKVALVAVVVLLFNGLGLVRIPVNPIPDDAYRYVRQIEDEMKSGPAEKILVDAGTWIYLSKGIVMKDRSTTIGDRGLGEVGDFSGMIRRLEDKRYDKILVRNLHRPDFHYDHSLWRRPSGIRDALLQNYRETGRIPPVSGKPHQHQTFLFGEISILEPRVG